MGLANTSSAPPREALGGPPQKRGGRRVQKARRGNEVDELQDQVAHLERDRALREERSEEPREEPGDDIDVWLERSVIEEREAGCRQADRIRAAETHAELEAARKANEDEMWERQRLWDEEKAAWGRNDFRRRAEPVSCSRYCPRSLLPGGMPIRSRGGVSGRSRSHSRWWRERQESSRQKNGERNSVIIIKSPS